MFSSAQLSQISRVPIRTIGALLVKRSVSATSRNGITWLCSVSVCVCMCCHSCCKRFVVNLAQREADAAAAVHTIFTCSQLHPSDADIRHIRRMLNLSFQICAYVLHTLTLAFKRLLSLQIETSAHDAPIVKDSMSTPISPSSQILASIDSCHLCRCSTGVLYSILTHTGGIPSHPTPISSRFENLCYLRVFTSWQGPVLSMNLTKR